ncbi:membrane hypothetical protein [Desulfamplus magnetovallimortis]|uniref:Major facilitator superfamily (MFS) profile domain-containing protein n=1 Tax=Desulfamplus magnetovallimortis TaxID=1246637 RepID=A0A1W1HDN3_9BACT|nr:MFS transporter [Desulfamplus magnetovallimortis]SLM30597.1 membrane hypothetical protein [Desulfamplus magnetovallimortis]
MNNNSETTSRHHYGTGMKIKLITSSILLLILALGFNTMLSLSSLEDIYIGSTFSKYTAIGNDLKRKIEKSIKFGKKIDKFFGMNSLLDEMRTHLIKDSFLPEDQKKNLQHDDFNLSVFLVLPHNEIRYSTDNAMIGDKLPLEVNGYFNEVFDNEGNENYSDKNFYKFEKEYYIALPVYKSVNKPWVGFIVIKLNERQVKAFINTVLMHDLELIGYILLGVVAVFIIFFFVILPGDSKKGGTSQRVVSVSVILILLIAQIFFSVFNTNSFKNYYLDISREKTAVLGSILKEDIEYLLNKGIALKRLFMMERMLGEIVSTSPELSNITIFDSEMHPLYMAERDRIIDFGKSGDEIAFAVDHYNKFKGSDYHVLINIMKGKSSEGSESHDNIGSISITISQKVLMSELTGIILDSITVLVISVLFLMELLVILFQFFSKEIDSIKNIARVNFNAIRPAIFIFFFGQTISVSFLPLYMEQLYEPFLGLSKEMIMGLPICTTMLFGGISPLIAGPWVDRRGWHEAFFTGVFLTAGGFVYTWLAPDAVHIIISRAFVGFGYGLTFMAANGFVVAFTDEKSKSQGLTRLIAGCYAGYICGSSTGGMLADRFGYNPVFFIGAVLISFSLIYALVFMKNAIVKKAGQVSENKEDGIFADAQRSYRISEVNNADRVFEISKDDRVSEISKDDRFSEINKDDLISNGNKDAHPPAAFQSDIDHGDEVPASKGTLLSFLTDIRVLALSVLFILPSSMITVGFLNYFMPIYIDSIGSTPSNIGRLLMVHGLFFIYIAPFFSRFIDHSSQKARYILLSGVIGSAGLGIFYFYGGMPAIIASVIILGFAGSFEAQIPYALDLKTTKALGSAQAIAILSSVEKIGQVAGPILFGWLILGQPDSRNLYNMGLAYLAIVLIFFMVGKGGKAEAAC